MATMIDSAKRIINGTFGSLWVDGRVIAEVKGLRLQTTKNDSAVKLCGDVNEDWKMTSLSHSGTVTLYHVDSGFAKEMEQVQEGKDIRHTIRSKLADPDVHGAESIDVFGVSFSTLTPADWQAATLGEISVPFKCKRYKFDELIPVK